MNKIFFIGFNKTATTSFDYLFSCSGYTSYHHWARIKKKKTYLAKQIYNNLQNNLPILNKIDNAHAYSDLISPVTDIDGKTFIYEANQNFDILYKEYPNAYFILNTRNIEDWVLSRSNHKNALKAWNKFFNISYGKTIDMWRKNFIKHHTSVREFFYNKPTANFLEFNIDTDRIDILIDYVKKDFILDKNYWTQKNKTTKYLKRKLNER